MRIHKGFKQDDLDHQQEHATQKKIVKGRSPSKPSFQTGSEILSTHRIGSSASAQRRVAQRL